MIKFIRKLFSRQPILRNPEIAELSELMLDTAPMCIQLWDKNYKTISCNKEAVNLYGFKNKQEYIERFVKDCNPEYQPDGQRSYEKALALVKKAFAGERCVFNWTHKMPNNDTPIPAEVTLIRVKHKDEYLVVGYTKDMRNVVMLEEKAEKIYYDPLTGICNRRYFDKNIKKYIHRLSHSKKFLSLMMIDVDSFKKFNDTYGHDEGDNCLKIIAKALYENITRSEDFVARYGGEEFVVVLPDTDEKGAHIVAEKLRLRIQELNIPHKKTTAAADCVTISIGVITVLPKHTHTATDYIKKADEMLYISKKEGRNKYTFGKL